MVCPTKGHNVWLVAWSGVMIFTPEDKTGHYDLKVGIMGNIIPKTGNTVFQFIEGITYETFETDDEMRIGTIKDMCAGKARIEWIATDRIEYVKVDETWIRLTEDKSSIVITTPWDGRESGHIPHHMQSRDKMVCCDRCTAMRANKA